MACMCGDPECPSCGPAQGTKPTRKRLSRRADLDAALAELAALYPEDGVLALATGPAAFLRRVVAEVKQLRAERTPEAGAVLREAERWATDHCASGYALLSEVERYRKARDSLPAT